MIINPSLKTTIHSKFSNISTLNNEERVATEIIFYKYILKLIDNTSQYNNINDIIENYIPLYTSKFVELKEKYYSYSQIINFLKKNDINNILSLQENDIDYIYDLYLESKEIINFSISNYCNEIYTFKHLNSRQQKYLQYIHNNVMVPIMKYYITNYSLKESDMKIIDSYSNNINVGKKITFYINGVDASNIFTDIINKRIPIKYNDIKFKYPNIEIINS